jgi:hypothetical protein
LAIDANDSSTDFQLELFGDAPALDLSDTNQETSKDKGEIGLKV